MSKEQLYIKRGNKYVPVDNYYNADNDIILFCAFRYALGRMTYVVGTVVEALVKAAPIMHDSDKEMYVSEIIEYYNSRGSIGMDMDTNAWKKLACFLDPTNVFTFEANYYNTDRWEECVGYKFGGQMYSKENFTNFYHTVRNVKGPEVYKTSIFNEPVSEEVININE